jgi:hypothetical protein
MYDGPNDFTIPAAIEINLGHDDEFSGSQNSDLDPFALRNDEYFAMLSRDGDLVEALMEIAEQPTDDVRDLEEIVKVETTYCTSVRTNADDTSRFVPPIYKERMLGVCTMIETQCHAKFSISTMIAEIADWRLNNKGQFSLSVRVRLKNKDDIQKRDFVDCYDRMNELYDGEMAKEHNYHAHFKDYFEELLECWALIDMTTTILVSEEEGHEISVKDLLAFAKTRVLLVSVIERLLYHHFEDSDSGGARSLKACVQDQGFASENESKSLEIYRNNIQRTGEKKYCYGVCGTDDLSNNNINQELLLQLLSCQKRRLDISKSAKRKYDQMIKQSADPQEGVPDLEHTEDPHQGVPDLEHTEDPYHGVPDLEHTEDPQQGVPDLERTDNAESDEDQTDEDHNNEDDNKQHAAFKETLQPFADPDFKSLITRLSNHTTDEDMLKFNHLFQVVIEAYEKKKGTMVLRNVQV